MFDFHSALMALGGGLIIGAGATAFLLFNGRIAGISNILAGLLTPKRSEVSWRAMFILGLIGGGMALSFFYPQAFNASHPRSLAVLAVAGLLVGLGARIGNGCTSGHGVCGLARRSLRSLVATAVFMTTAIATVYVTNHLLAQAFR